MDANGAALVDNTQYHDPKPLNDETLYHESKSERIQSYSIRSSDHDAITNSLSFNYPNNGSLNESISSLTNRPLSSVSSNDLSVNDGSKEQIHRKNDCNNDIETITLNDDDIKIELGDDVEEVQINDRLPDNNISNIISNNGQQMSFQLGNHRLNIPTASAAPFQHHSSVSLTPTSAMFMQQKRPSPSDMAVSTDKSKRARLDQPTIEISLDNLQAIGKKEALMLTKDQIELMLRVNAPEVTLVSHVVRRPDLEKYWTYIRKINVNGHQTVWTQCTSKFRLHINLHIYIYAISYYPLVSIWSTFLFVC